VIYRIFNAIFKKMISSKKERRVEMMDHGPRSDDPGPEGGKG
jgi:hypothetical protein